MHAFNYRELLNYHRRISMSFSEFVERFLEDPKRYLYTSSTIISEAIKFFGYEIVIRSGEPVISYNIFRDIFSNGVYAVYGQEFCIKQLVDVIDSIGKESGPSRGIVMVGPPASGKTNIVDLITLAMEQYTKEESVKLYSFYYQFVDEEDPEQILEIRSSFMPNPILFFTTILQRDDGITRPRQELFDYINSTRNEREKISIPTYYQNASLDKRNLDILESLIQNPRNHGKSLFDILEEYVRVEEIEFSNAQAMGIANIDDLRRLPVKIRPIDTRESALRILNTHLPTKLLYEYTGAMVSANRGILHVHDAFGGESDEDGYKPLLMLLGSGKISLESTQTAVDTTVVITTNIEEMEQLEQQLTASKLLDRIDKIPVNYLLDYSSEMEILKRDMSNVHDKYDVDPNLFRIAAYYSVMTRFLPPMKERLPDTWSDARKRVYYDITPEQKLFIYGCQPEDPVTTIHKLPLWHPFRSEARKIGLDLSREELAKHIVATPTAVSLEGCGVFRAEELAHIDDDFMRILWHEHRTREGQHGISIRQLQNIMRNTISHSDGSKVMVDTFLNQLRQIMREGPDQHHWLSQEPPISKNRKSIRSREIGGRRFAQGECDYGDYRGLVEVVEAIYHAILQREIITATVDRDPEKVEEDLRKYVQFCLLGQAIENKAFAHIMVPRFSFVDPRTGGKVDRPDLNFMATVEKLLAPGKDAAAYRRDTAQKFFDLQEAGRIEIERNRTVFTSRNDHFLSGFEQEYHVLLTHRKTDETVDGDQLRNAFFQKQKDPTEYMQFPDAYRRFADAILRNMDDRFHYSRNIALDVVVYALRKQIIDFKEILN